MTQTKLPENWAVKIDKNNPIYENFREWYSINFEPGLEFTLKYYSYDTCFDFIDEHNSSYNIITLEQWNEAVNGKEETNLEKAFRLYPIGTKYIDASRNKESHIVEAQNFHEHNRDIHAEYAKGILYRANENKWAEIVNSFDSSVKQPRLKVGDKLPLYLSGKLNYGGLDGKIVDRIYFDFTEDQDIRVTNKNKELYWVRNYKNTYCMLISDVDALIEEHEREIENITEGVFPLDRLCDNEYLEEQSSEGLENYFYKNEYGNEIQVNCPKNTANTPYLEEWIPKNGEEVNCYDKNGAWVDVGQYVGMDKNRFIVKIETGYDWFAGIKPVVIKTKTEIAELLGISKEQLKIVEG